MASPERPPDPEEATYVYGVTRAGIDPPDVAGIGTPGAPVRVVSWEALAAIVSDVSRDDVAAAARSLRAHARVLDAAVEAGSVVPLRFGTMVDDDRAVVDKVLQPHRDHLEGLLDRLGHHVELAVKATYDEDAVVRDLVAADPAIAALHGRIAGVDPEAAYYGRIQLGDRVAAALEKRRDRDAEELYDALGEVTDDVSAGEPLNPHMVVNGTFLVRRSSLDTFDDRLSAVARAHPEMAIRCVGPLPPYSFSDIELAG